MDPKYFLKVLGQFFLSATHEAVSVRDLVYIYEPSIRQKQPPEVFCKKRFSHKFNKIHRKTPLPESLF